MRCNNLYKRCGLGNSVAAHERDAAAFLGQLCLPRASLPAGQL